MFNLRRRLKKAIVVACASALLITEPNVATNIKIVKAESLDNFYVLDVNNNLKEYLGKDTEIVLPLEVNGKQVKGISDAFKGSDIKKVTIPAGFPQINAGAFSNCDELEEVLVEGPIEYIGGKAFKGCSSLNTIEVQCTEVWDNAFENCTSLTNATFTGVTEFKKEVFKGCSSLRKVSIPEKVSYLDCSSFINCESLEITVYGMDTRLSSAVYMPKTATIVCYEGAEIEKDCEENGISVSYLKNSTTPQPTLVTSEPTSFTKDGFTVSKSGTLIEYSGNASDNIEIPSEISGIEVKSIGSDAFRGLNIKNVKIPNSVRKISASAFAFCNFLETITIPSSVSEIGPSAFLDCQSLKSVTIENGLAEIPVDCFQSCEKLETVVLPESIALINTGAFVYCTALKMITIPSESVFISATSFSGDADVVVICKKGSKVDTTMASFGFERVYLADSTSDQVTEEPTQKPTMSPTSIPTTEPPSVTVEPPMGTLVPSIGTPTMKPSNETVTPSTESPVVETMKPTVEPIEPSVVETEQPTEQLEEPTQAPGNNSADLSVTNVPTVEQTVIPTVKPTSPQIVEPTAIATKVPTASPVVLKKKTIKIGKEEKVSFPLKNKTGKKIKYTAKNKKIVTVSSKGIIKGKNVGETKVYATVSGKTLSLTVKVKKKPVSIKISSVSKVKMSIGGKLILQAIMNSGAASYNVKWSSSNKKVVTVNNSGVATIKGKGRAVIKVKTYNGVTGTLKLNIK